VADLDPTFTPPETPPASQDRDPWLDQVAASDQYGHTFRPGRLKVRAPDGTLGTIPEDKRQDATSRGLKIIGPDQRVRGFFGKDTVTVPPERLQEAMKSGFVPMTHEEAADYEQKNTIKESFDMPGTAFLGHLANSAGLGIPLAAPRSLGQGQREFEAAVQAHAPEELTITRNASRAFRAMFGEGYNPDEHDPKKDAAFEALKNQARGVQGTPEPQQEENDMDRLGLGLGLMSGSNRKSSIAGEMAGMFTAGPSGVMGAARRPAAALAAPAAERVGAYVATRTGSWKAGLAAEKAVSGAAGEAAAGLALSGAQAPAKLSEQPLGPEAFWAELKSAGIFAATGAALGGVGGALGSLIRTRNLGFRDSPQVQKLRSIFDEEQARADSSSVSADGRRSAIEWAKDNKELVDQHPDIKRTIEELAKARKQMDVRKYSEAELQLKINLDEASDLALGDLLPSRAGTAQRREGEAFRDLKVQNLHAIAADKYDGAGKILRDNPSLDQDLAGQLGQGVGSRGRALVVAQRMRDAMEGGGLDVEGGAADFRGAVEDVLPPEGRASGLGWLNQTNIREAGRPASPPPTPQSATVPEGQYASGDLAVGATSPAKPGARVAGARQADSLFPVGGWQDVAEQNVNDVLSSAAATLKNGGSVDAKSVLDELLEAGLHGRDPEAIASIASRTAEHLEKIAELQDVGTSSVSKRIGYIAARAATQISDRLDRYYRLMNARENVGLPQSPTLEDAGVQTRGLGAGSELDPAALGAGQRAQALAGKLDTQRASMGQIGQAFEAEAHTAAAAKARADAGDPGLASSYQPATRGPPPPPTDASAPAPASKIFGGNVLVDVAHAAIGAALGGFGGPHGAFIAGGATFALRILKRFFGARLHAAVKDLTDLQPQFLKTVDAKIGSIFRGAQGAATGAADALMKTGKALAAETSPEIPSLVGRLSASNYGEEDAGERTSLPEMAKAKADAIAKMAADPKGTESRIHDALSPLKILDPVLIDKTVQHFMDRIKFLSSKAPKSAQAPVLSGSSEVPSVSAATRFARYVTSAEDPAGVLLDGIRSGEVWPETIETIQALTPQLDEFLRMRLVGAAVRDDKPLPYAQRQAMASAFGSAMNPIRDPKFTSWYLDAMAKAVQDKQEQEQQPGDAGGYTVPKRKIDLGSQARGTLGQRLGA
jgi:hypothetical protein